MTPYHEINERVRVMIACGFGFDFLLAERPQLLSEIELQHLRNQYEIIKRFQQICVDLFFESLEDSGHWLAKLLMRDLTSSYGLEFHRQLPEHLRTTPRFFRTDQPNIKTVAEIQCPGSGWGECALLTHYFRDHNLLPPETLTIDEAFNLSLRDFLRTDPVIHHLTDNASSLLSNLFFINATRRAKGAPAYIGFDPGVRPQDCNFIRTHLFEGMMSENFGRLRLIQGSKGLLHYDYPPMCIFEEKLLMALPFHPETRARFDDDVRSIFPWTALLLPEGCAIQEDAFVRLEEIPKLARKSRRFFIKYAGIDSSRNWGSRAVYYAADFTASRLSALLSKIANEFLAGGGCWIVQESVSEEGSATFFDRNGELECRHGYKKLSGFYGPSGLLGLSTMHRIARKVHGQSDTVMGAVDMSVGGR